MIIKEHFQKLVMPLVIAGAIVLIVLFSYAFRTSDPRTDIADAEYKAGESAKTIAARENAFNKALESYMSLEQDYKPTYGTGWLYYNLGNTYFQLGEYGHAMLYYARAQALMPRSDHVQRNIDVTRKKLDISKKEEAGAFKKLFFFHTLLSLPERLQVFFVLSLISFVTLTAYLWIENAIYKKIAMLTAVLAGIMFLSLGYTYYLSPIEAILVKSVDLRRDAGEQYERVSKEPIPAGTEVEVLNIRPDGKWLKVSTVKGDMGYVPQESIGLIGP